MLHALNQLDTKKNQVVILWKSLTIMSPQEVRAFDEQQTACARLFYRTDQGYLQGYMELDTWLYNALQATPPVDDVRRVHTLELCVEPRGLWCAT